MPDIQAFRGIRYDLKHVGSLSNVVCPPYDVIDAKFQDDLYKKHPANFIRLELNREEPGDDEQNNKYSRAARFLKNWLNEGVLQNESQPAIYVYHQVFSYGGQEYTRRGFMCRCRTVRFGQGNIYPHEETMSGPKQDRLLLTKATKTNLSQIFGLYPDPENTAQNLLEKHIAGQTPTEATDHLGVIHRVWAVTDPAIISQLTGVMGPKPIFIADGHHRYETSCNYKDEIAAASGGTLPDNHPANFVLMVCIGMDDPGLIVLPTHRLFSGIPELDSSELAAKLKPSFDCRVVGEGTDLAETVWNKIESEADQGAIGLYTKKDDRWTIATLTDAGRAKMAEIASEHSEDWQELGVALLHRLLVDTLLGAKGHPKPHYVHLVSEVVESLETGEYPLAALVMPATVEHIRVISEHSERMPAKSTYFYPKLLGGLVVNPLE
ncbi:MAG: DUF1015 domain-containing protein [Planctomycetota bacterium]|nr:DUF1015 domain-containing protein [Planctomycetota bacterium]